MWDLISSMDLIEFKSWFCIIVFNFNQCHALTKTLHKLNRSKQWPFLLINRDFFSFVARLSFATLRLIQIRIEFSCPFFWRGAFIFILISEIFKFVYDVLRFAYIFRLSRNFLFRFNHVESCKDYAEFVYKTNVSDGMRDHAMTSAFVQAFDLCVVCFCREWLFFGATNTNKSMFL